MSQTVNELIRNRAAMIDKMRSFSALPKLSAAQAREFDDLVDEVKALDSRVDRLKKVEASMARAARPIGGGLRSFSEGLNAQPSCDPYEKDASLALGGMVRSIAGARGDSVAAVERATTQYGERHPVTEGLQQSKALSTSTGVSGGFVIPPDFVDALITLLYAKAVVRKAGALTMPMPNGTMTFPKMTGGSSAYWMGEANPIPASQQSFGQVIATAKKLAALVPVSNDMMRYASPSFDASIRDDVVMQLALAEDAAFIRSGGTQYTPRGMKAFAVAFGSHVFQSTPGYSLSTVAQELGGLITALELSNVPMAKPGWLMNPRTKNYLLNVQNSNGFYVFREEMTQPKTLLGYPFFTTTQIPTNIVVGGNSDTSELYFADFAETMILESRQMEFAISTEGNYVDANGIQQSAFQNDLCLVRGIMSEDFQMRHDEGVALLTGVRWAPAIEP